jgi:hypothetical protein
MYSKKKKELKILGIEIYLEWVMVDDDLLKLEQ